MFPADFLMSQLNIEEKRYYCSAKLSFCRRGHVLRVIRTRGLTVDCQGSSAVAWDGNNSIVERVSSLDSGSAGISSQNAKPFNEGGYHSDDAVDKRASH